MVYKPLNYQNLTISQDQLLRQTSLQQVSEINNQLVLVHHNQDQGNDKETSWRYLSLGHGNNETFTQ
jgi:hypothetical protein